MMRVIGVSRLIWAACLRLRRPVPLGASSVTAFEVATLPVDASCWLAWGNKKEATILEESRSLTSYDAVLTLLHIDQDIEPEWEPQESFTPDGRYRRR